MSGVRIISVLHVVLNYLLEEFPVTGIIRDSVRTTVLRVTVFCNYSRTKDAHVFVTYPCYIFSLQCHIVDIITMSIGLLTLVLHN